MIWHFYVFVKHGSLRYLEQVLEKLPSELHHL